MFESYSSDLLSFFPSSSSFSSYLPSSKKSSDPVFDSAPSSSDGSQNPSVINPVGSPPDLRKSDGYPTIDKKPHVPPSSEAYAASSDSKSKQNDPSNARTSSSKSKDNMQLGSLSQSDEKLEKTIVIPCTTTSHATGNFFDLQPLIKKYPQDMADWQVRGINYPANFTLNFCAPLLLPVNFDEQGLSHEAELDKPLTNILNGADGLETIVENPSASISLSNSANVSAVARYGDGTIKSLGTASSTPYFRGRNLLLEYHNGSPCIGPDGSATGLKMSTLISIKCDHDLAASHAAISFIGSPDNCTYFFEARSVHACPASNKEESMAPVPIFLVFCGVAVLVYALASMLLTPYKKNGSGGCGPICGSSGSSSDTNEGSILPIYAQDLSNEGANTFVFPFPLGFLNPLLYRVRRLRYIPVKASQLGADGETITVFEALTNSKPAASAYFRRSNQYSPRGEDKKSGDFSESSLEDSHYITRSASRSSSHSVNGSITSIGSIGEKTSV